MRPLITIIECVLCGAWLTPAAFAHHWHEEDWGNDFTFLAEEN